MTHEGWCWVACLPAACLIMMMLGVSLPLTSESPMNFKLSTKKMNFTLKTLKSFFSDAASIISQGGGWSGGFSVPITIISQTNDLTGIDIYPNSPLFLHSEFLSIFTDISTGIANISGSIVGK